VRTEHLFAPTLRQVSGDVELASHRLLLRGGFIRQLAAGVYSLLPLGVRVIHKLEAIVREESDAAGAQEVFLPTLHPLELWEKTGRAQYLGPELMQLKDRNGRPFCLGPTHEEVLTTLVGAEVRSYRDLPFTLYQIQTKFRDDPRPRGGLVRLREFSMHDAYSFDRDVAGLDRSFEVMVEAYHRILKRIGIPYDVVEASGGVIGGWDTKEFELRSESGESHYLRCIHCGCAATMEVAQFPSPSSAEPTEEMLPYQPVDTPNAKTIEAVTALLKLSARKLVKTLLYKAGGRVVAALVRGDRELSEDKLRAALGGGKLRMADAATVEQVSRAPVGFAGPVGLTGVEIIADEELRGERNFVTGGNAADTHLLNVNWDRDFRVSKWAQLRNAVAGDLCPNCSHPLDAYRGIELAHVFKLGSIYSEPLDAFFLDEGGQRKPIQMGCYGLGNTRMIAAIAEHFHDDAGLIWPTSVAPFDIIVIPVNHDDVTQRELAEQIYRELMIEGHDVLLETRAERPGVKFKDADLIGIPGQVVVGRLAGEGKVEVRRRGGTSRTVEVREVSPAIRELLLEACPR
jgi:prolyl-tRNA synthetase